MEITITLTDQDHAVLTQDLQERQGKIPEEFFRGKALEIVRNALVRQIEVEEKKKAREDPRLEIQELHQRLELLIKK